MTVGVGTELSAALGTGAGPGVGIGAGAGLGLGAFGRTAGAVRSGTGASANLEGTPWERVGGASEETVTGAAAKSSKLAWLSSGTSSGPAAVGNENFKANWQSMLRAWGLHADSADEIEETAGQVQGQSGAMGAAQARAGQADVIGKRLGQAGNQTEGSEFARIIGDSTASNAAASTRNSPRTNLNLSQNAAVAQPSAQDRAPWSATQTTAASTSARSTIDKKASGTNSEATHKTSRVEAGFTADGLTAGLELAMQTSLPSAPGSGPRTPAACLQPAPWPAPAAEFSPTVFPWPCLLFPLQPPAASFQPLASSCRHRASFSRNPTLSFVRTPLTHLSFR